MKKKTVITTEKREVWIIRQSPPPTEDYEMTGNEAAPFVDLLNELLYKQPETETPIF